MALMEGMLVVLKDVLAIQCSAFESFFWIKHWTSSGSGSLCESPRSSSDSSRTKSCEVRIVRCLNAMFMFQ